MIHSRSTFFLYSIFTFGLAAVAAQNTKSNRPPALDQLFVEARSAFERGEFERGIEVLKPAVQQHTDPARQSEATILASQGYEALGRNSDSVRILEEALARVSDASEHSVRLRDRLAAAYRLTGQPDRAQAALDRALRDANDSGRNDLRAIITNDLGTLQAATENLEAAIRSFEESARLAHEAGLGELELTAGINEGAALIQYGRSDGLEPVLARDTEIVNEMSSSHRKALCLLSIGSQYWLAQRAFGFDATWRKRAYEAYDAGVKAARAIANPSLISYGLGSIGRLYEDERRYDEALRYTRWAVIQAEQADASDVLYQWQWQVARILRQRGQVDAALDGYRQAIRTLEGIRSSLSRASVPFQTVVGPVFLELADLLLHRATVEGDGASGQRDLAEVLATVEKLNQAEVAEYFRDDCVVQTQGTTQLDNVASDAAVVYPVLLPDRIEIVLSLRGSLSHYAVPVGLQEITSVIREFRQNIETFDPRNAFMRPARRLHSLLVKPMEAELRQAGVTTIVFVPQGPLRTIPFAALNDGESFLIDRYAVVTTPGLTLTSARPLPRTDVRTLAAGLTSAVQGFNALPSVNSELAGIADLFPTMRLQDRTFSTFNVEGAVSRGEYSVVHLATHGYFDSDHSRSFLLTFDGKITMDSLQSTVGRRKYSDEPLELLVLSACETASGDDRAALGLAGAGLRAGSRSVVATLWPIGDESTSRLIAEFYRRLKDPRNSKAEALRGAQRELLKQDRFRHPFFWAPFLLIGNWL